MCEGSMNFGAKYPINRVVGIGKNGAKEEKEPDVMGYFLLECEFVQFSTEPSGDEMDESEGHGEEEFVLLFILIDVIIENYFKRKFILLQNEN